MNCPSLFLEPALFMEASEVVQLPWPLLRLCAWILAHDQKRCSVLQGACSPNHIAVVQLYLLLPCCSLQPVLSLKELPSGKQTPPGSFHRWSRQQGKEQGKQNRNIDLFQQLFWGKSYFKGFSWILRNGLKTRLEWECNFVLNQNAANLRNNG